MPTLGQHDYPLTTVADGIENAKKIVLQFKGQSFDRKALAAALGNKSAETGAFNQRLADLRRFGVIDGRGETLQVTALAQRLAIPTNNDEFSDAVFEMMTRVPLFKLLYEHTEGKSPTEDELLATLINLTKADRASMQSALELRAPFLDQAVMEFAATLPVADRVRGLTTKRFLKQYALRYLPSSIVYRRKRGLSVPLSRWLRGPLHEWAESRLRSKLLGEAGVNVRAAGELLEEHRQRRADHARALWTLIVLSEWLDWASNRVAG